MTLVRHVATVPAIGSVGVVASDRGVVSIEIHAWPQQGAMRHRRDPVEPGMHPIIGAVLRSLEVYLLGRSSDFPIACDFAGIPPLRRAALEAVRAVPYGQTRTYAQLAARIPNGTEPVVRDALTANPMPILIPCHRAVDQAHLGPYIGPIAAKRQLLAIEGLDTAKLPDPPVRQSGTTRIWR